MAIDIKDFPDIRDLPDIDDAEFQSYIRRPPCASDKLEPEPQIHGDKESTDTRQHPTYASFGDSGTTATASGYGTIMRLSRYLGGENNPSKMVGLEFMEGDTPYYITYRAEIFQRGLSVPDSGFGVRIMDADSLQLVVPKLDFLNDRWPQITYSVKGFNVRVRLFCQNGSVIQRFTVTKTLTSTEDLEIVLDVRFLMHQLDYMNEVEYKTKFDRGPHGYSVIVSGQRTDEENEDGTSEKVGVLVELFRNGESENLSLLNVDEVSQNRGIMKIKCPSQESETLELTAAFRLQYVKRSSVWKDFILPISELDGSEVIQNPQLALGPDPWPFPRGDLLNWHLRRNLEHILSVCSIPLNPPKDGTGHRATPIALTCGDFGDHRVSVSGSFFAFQYLLSMYQQLGKKLDPDAAAQSLRSRIRDTCKGHLQWVAELNRDKRFASNFWVDGEIIEPNVYTELPPDSPANIPMHILKATEFLTVFKEQEQEELIFASEWLPSFVIFWIENLIKTRNHLATTWQHIPDGPDIAKYRLSDHVWIWRALQSIEQLIAKVEDINPSLPDLNTEKILELKNYLPNRKNKGNEASSRLEFTSDELRKQILRRFTLVNDISKRRMLSSSRSARETRYMFHSRDTVLYYGMKWGFFRDDSKPVSELWELLVQSQPQHDEGNDETQWDNPLRYALAVLMGVEDHQFDKNYSASEMASHAKSVLLESSSKNGLFPGQIDERTKEAVPFDREIFRDFYFHAGFEIPYVLLRAESKRPLRTELEEEYRDGEQRRLDIEGGTKTIEHGKSVKGSEATLKPSQSPAQDEQPKHQSIRRPSTALSSPVTNMVDRFQSHLEPSENRISAAVNDGVWNILPDGRAIHTVRSLKRNVPYGKVVDLSNIIEPSDEWLYDYPRFLNFEPPNDKDAATILTLADGITIAKCVEGKFSKKDMGEFFMKNIFGESPVPVTFIIIDVPKGKKKRKKFVDVRLHSDYKDESYKDLWSRLQEKRTAEEAKKRLIYLGPEDCTVAALCYLASCDMEREHISQFFDRHETAREFIVDDTIVAFNSWETELHLSFYQLVKCRSTKHEFIPVRAVESEKFFFLDEDSLISEAAISFRIVGDYFDRYWTCHIIETYFPKSESFDLGNHSQSHWQQRKVLELILFERILSKVHQGAHDIIDAIEKCATKKIDVGENHLSGRLRFEDLTIENLQEILQVLVVLKNSFATILEIVELWKNRESTHGQERPRWTRNDEQKYGRSIQKRFALQERCIRDLKNKQARIEFLITLVTSAQEAVRSARSLREAENIRLFTYLTAFFLPVGLSSSLFGMGQIPNRNVVVTMIITAAIALFVTALVLYCTLSPTVAAKIGKIRNDFKDNKRKKREPKLDGAKKKIGTLRERWRPSKKLAEEPKEGPVEDIESGSMHSDLMLNGARRV